MNNHLIKMFCFILFYIHLRTSLAFCLQNGPTSTNHIQFNLACHSNVWQKMVWLSQKQNDHAQIFVVCLHRIKSLCIPLFSLIFITAAAAIQRVTKSQNHSNLNWSPFKAVGSAFSTYETSKPKEKLVIFLKYLPQVIPWICMHFQIDQ